MSNGGSGSGCTVRGEREQSVADSMWANAPMPPLNPRTRTAPPKRHLSIFQQERTASIEPSGCTARMEIAKPMWRRERNDLTRHFHRKLQMCSPI
jgi:hypothetical protein